MDIWETPKGRSWKLVIPRTDLTGKDLGTYKSKKEAIDAFADHLKRDQ